MEKCCDNKSVGVVLCNNLGQIALLERGRFPIGIAPPAGHVDSHGSLKQAAIDEVVEEIGVALRVEDLHETVIRQRRVDNVCRRLGGGYHVWTVYEAMVEQASLRPDPHETNGAEWHSMAGLQQLAHRTELYRIGMVSDEEWRQKPGLESVWVEFLSELGHLRSD